MKRKKIYLFGCSKQRITLEKELRMGGYEVVVVEAKKNHSDKIKEIETEKIHYIDVMQDSQIKSLQIKDGEMIVCMMEDEHLNVFLTLSLRSLYPKAVIFAISSSIHTTQKLEIAGANRVINLYQVSAHRIHNILTKPVATKLLDSFITHDSSISVREIMIPKGSFLHGKMTEEVDFSSYDVLLLGLVDVELGNKFMFITNKGEHKLDTGDIMVCMGYNENLDSFEELIKQNGAKK